MQAKDVPEQPILDFIAAAHPKWCNWGDGERGLMNAVPLGTPPKVLLAKLASMIRRGLIDGCDCGCRGDFRMREKVR